jgi:hypothetical protein
MLRWMIVKVGEFAYRGELASDRSAGALNGCPVPPFSISASQWQEERGPIDIDGLIDDDDRFACLRANRPTA